MNFNLLFYLFFLIIFGSGQEIIDIELSHEYKNFTTKGNLIPDLFRVPIDLRKVPPTIRVVITAEHSVPSNPLCVDAVKGKSVMDVHVPRFQTFKGKCHQYWFSADTMCEDVISQKQLLEPALVSVASAEPLNYTLRVKGVYNFDIGNTPFNSSVTASEPKFFRYTFPKDVDDIFIKVTSNSDICGRILTRKLNCPVFDAYGLVDMKDVVYYQSFTRFSSFHVNRKEIGDSFHLVYTVFPDDSECGTSPKLSKNMYRIKTSEILVEPSIRTQDEIALLPLLFYSMGILAVLLASYHHSKWLDRQENNEPCIFEGTDTEGTEILTDVEFFEAPTMTVSHKQYEKRRIVKQSKYFNFFYFQIFGALLPSMTTLFENRLARFKVMNLDACNINFLCSFEIFGFTSFNSMASASSLIFLGVANLLAVFRNRIFRRTNGRSNEIQTHGLLQLDAPKVVYIMSMIGLGFFWTITSSCRLPTTIHLYVYTLIWVFLSGIMWFYSKRHGVRKWQQSFIIIVSSVLAIFTFIENNFEYGESVSVILRILMSLFSISFTIYFCHKYCYEKPSGLDEHQWIQSPFYSGEKIIGDEKEVYQPLKIKKVLAALLIMWTVYWTACAPFIFVYSHTEILIRLIEIDLLLYMFFYFSQKVRFERPTFTIGYVTTCIFFFFILTFSCVAWALVFFFKRNSNPAMTAAQSRILNNHCIIPGVDWNDVHLYISCLVGISFMFLMDFIDTNIKGVPRKFIFVF